jgi:L-arabinose isomerase
MRDEKGTLYNCCFCNGKALWAHHRRHLSIHSQSTEIRSVRSHVENESQQLATPSNFPLQYHNLGLHPQQNHIITTGINIAHFNNVLVLILLTHSQSFHCYVIIDIRVKRKYKIEYGKTEKQIPWEWLMNPAMFLQYWAST